MRGWLRWRMTGPGAWAVPTSGPTRFHPRSMPFLPAAMRPIRSAPRPCCCGTRRAATIACTRNLYGALAFPLQATCFLSRPAADYRGGEFLLVEQRPRQQSRGTALLPEQGALVLFPSAERPAPSKRGFARVRARHGVSTVASGLRFTLGIIFHDAA